MAQIVDFRNNQTDFPTPADRDVYYTDMVSPLVGTNFQARLLYGADASSLQPAVYITPARFRNITTGALNAGTWVGGNRTLSGFMSGDIVTLQVQVWDSTGDLTFDQAKAGGFLWAHSALFTYTIPGADADPREFYMDNFRSMPGLIPEPSVVALGAIGALAMLLLKVRRRAR